MSKISKEARLAAAQAVEAGESIGSVAKRYHIDRRDMSYLARLYHAHGRERLIGPTDHWSAEQKYEVLQYKNEKRLTSRETGIKFGIRGRSIIRQWEQRYLEKGIEGLEGKKKSRKPRERKPKPPKTREEELLERIEDLEIENEYLKKLNALVAEREKRERGNR